MDRPKDVFWGLIGILGFAWVAAKLGELAGWDLSWLFIVAVVIDVAIVVAYILRRRRSSPKDYGPSGNATS
jgi:heme/copper-type cytochrome/quinol oxidase subunit 2